MFLLRYNWAFYFLLALWENVGGIYGSMAMLWRFLVKACQKVEAIEQHILPLTTSWRHPWGNLPLARKDRRFTIRTQHRSFGPGQMQTTEKEKALKKANKQKDIEKNKTEWNKLMHRPTRLFINKKRTRVCWTWLKNNSTSFNEMSSHACSTFCRNFPAMSSVTEPRQFAFICLMQSFCRPDRTMQWEKLRQFFTDQSSKVKKKRHRNVTKMSNGRYNFVWLWGVSGTVRCLYIFCYPHSQEQ